VAFTISYPSFTGHAFAVYTYSVKGICARQRRRQSGDEAMKDKVTESVLLAMVLATGGTMLPAAASEPRQPWAPGIESPGYVWNEQKGEKLLALKAEGNVIRGEIAFEVCQNCHGFGAPGDAEGRYPRLAGQHASVLIKQMTDVRAGRRDYPSEYPFLTEHIVNVQEIADVAAYLESLPVTSDNGKGRGDDLERGQALFVEDCETCHGVYGEGDAEGFFPRVSGQHYGYLVRESRDIRDGRRRNANPEMVDAIDDYTDEEIEAVADFMSRLPIDVPQEGSAEGS
jgi:cytochrome c553